MYTHWSINKRTYLRFINILNTFQQSNSVYDSTLFEAGGQTPMNPLYSASLQSPDSIASAQSLEVPTSYYNNQNMPST